MRHMNNIVLSSGVNYLDRFIDEAVVNVKNNSILNIINLGKNLHLHFKIENNANLTVNMFDYAEDISIYLTVEAADRSHFVLNAGFIAEGKYDLNIDTNLYGDDIDVDVNIRGINEENGVVKILMNGTVAGETKNNVLNEYARIINKSVSTNVLIPNLIVNTNEVVANHGVSIGGFNDDELFYLTSKGIKKSNARRLIENGFILSIMDDDNREKIKNILIGR